MSQWKIDTLKKDYVLERGQPVQTNEQTAPAYFRLKIQRQRWMYDPAIGSDLHLFRKRHSPSAHSDLETSAARALEPMIDDGRLSDVAITTKVANRTASIMEATLFDALGEPQKLTFNPVE